MNPRQGLPLRILEDKKTEILEEIKEISERAEYPFKKNCLRLLNESVSEINASIYLLRYAEELEAYRRTLMAFANIIQICPKCRKYFILDGLKCLGCRYDGHSR
jgi:hypothetical protein